MDELIRNTVCPRCKGDIPVRDNPGTPMGALSRYDNMTEICAACGVAEAMWKWFESRDEDGHIGPLPDLSVNIRKVAE